MLQCLWTRDIEGGCHPVRSAEFGSFFFMSIDDLAIAEDQCLNNKLTSLSCLIRKVFFYILHGFEYLNKKNGQASYIHSNDTIQFLCTFFHLTVSMHQHAIHVPGKIPIYCNISKKQVTLQRQKLKLSPSLVFYCMINTTEIYLTDSYSSVQDLKYN